MTKNLADIFNNNPAFSTSEMTDAINIIPTQYGTINKLGIFKDKGVKTTSVMVERKNGVLSVSPKLACVNSLCRVSRTVEPISSSSSSCL